MTSRNRLIVVAVLLVCAIAAAAAYALLGNGKPASTPVKPSATARATAAAGAWLPADPAMADVCRSRLPSQARDTLTLIAEGGPYPYRSDGVVFENRESRLPRHPKGYYHEYTVVTPGSEDRGTRRVVTGTVGEEYWTADHYNTFQEIDVRC
ncbi:ribonuclease domain-containing protein [Kitasatospora atroaurantiaca]|nr:ribonuclease domain-containing protein [Kitasatospora atroaurantiaca]